MPVFKTTITITVFADTFDTIEQCQTFMANADTDHIIQQMQDGDFIGQAHVGQTVEVPKDQLQTEMEAIGNDGSFFNLNDEEDEDECPCL